MFIYVEVHRPKPEYRHELIAAMNRVRLEALGTPGLKEIGPWTESDDGTKVVGMSMWESRAHWERRSPEVFKLWWDAPVDFWAAAPVERMLLDDAGAFPADAMER
ncbi:antibiotic biosynthesis monooxygenase [Agromyces seonyuensis]|uniref:ABM domain-containing protein n=1 Tax=Agromyces seonyuensis TaxID=2662446 RepID=A0A6I4P6R4_9MICO|nr:antibiotic biosynthesis monooxygenase [Agromyces seonyuensis]MWC00340.1 hypothetical protein [Agromyces seonyuensis]